jgi:hypothetical protein
MFDIYLILVKLGSLLQYGLVFLLLMLVMVYFMQEKMLYGPEAPSKEYKFPEGNPVGFRNPGERGLNYEDAYIKTSDGVTLHGWFVKQ